MIKLPLSIVIIVLITFVAYFLGVKILVGVIGVFLSTIGGYLFGIGALGEGRLVKFELQVRKLETFSERFLDILFHKKPSLMLEKLPLFLLRIYFLIIVFMFSLSLIANLYWNKGFLESSSWGSIGIHSFLILTHIYLVIASYKYKVHKIMTDNNVDLEKLSLFGVLFRFWLLVPFLISLGIVLSFLFLVYLFVDCLIECSLKILNSLKKEWKSKYTAPALGLTLLFLGIIIWIISLFLK